MKIAIIGAGNVGGTLGAAWADPITASRDLRE
jgi:predicted dinucleotide-binding enzyme